MTVLNCYILSFIIYKCLLLLENNIYEIYLYGNI